MFGSQHRPSRAHALWFWLAAPLAWLVLSSMLSEDRRVLRPARAPDPAAVALLFGERLDPNTAASRDLELLPTLGPARASAIVEHAKERPFRTLRDLEDVGGIGPKTVEKLTPWLEIQSLVADSGSSAQSPEECGTRPGEVRPASGGASCGSRATEQGLAREQRWERSAYGRRGR